MTQKKPQFATIVAFWAIKLVSVLKTIAEEMVGAAAAMTDPMEAAVADPTAAVDLMVEAMETDLMVGELLVVVEETLSTFTTITESLPMLTSTVANDAQSHHQQ